MLQAKVRLFEAAEALPNMRRYVNETFGERWDEYADAFSEQMQRMEGVSWETSNWVVLYRVYPTRSADIEASLHPANLRVVMKADAAREQAILAQNLHRRERPPAAIIGASQSDQPAVRGGGHGREREAMVRSAIIRALMAARDDGAPIDAMAIASEIGVEEVREHIEHLSRQLQTMLDWKECGRSWDIYPRRPLIAHECVREGLSPGELVVVTSDSIAAKQSQLRAEAERVQRDRIMRRWGLEEVSDAVYMVPRHDASRDAVLLDALTKLWNRACGQGCAPLPRETIRLDRLSTSIDYQMYCHNRQLPARKQLSWDNIGIRWALRYKVGCTIDEITSQPDSRVIVTRL
ncbi:g498 [Coccomyxa elongata]